MLEQNSFLECKSRSWKVSHWSLISAFTLVLLHKYGYGTFTSVFCMLFVLMYFIYFMYMLCFCILCSYTIYEWPEFYVNKDMFCSVNKDFCHLLITFANSKDPDQGQEECRSWSWSEPTDTLIVCSRKNLLKKKYLNQCRLLITLQTVRTKIRTNWKSFLVCIQKCLTF